MIALHMKASVTSRGLKRKHQVRATPDLMYQFIFAEARSDASGNAIGAVRLLLKSTYC